MFAPLLKRNTLEQTGFRLTEGAISYGNKTYLVSDILELRSFRSIRQTTHNVVGPTIQHDPAIAIVVTMQGGEVLSVVEQSTVFRASKRDRVEALQSAYDELCLKSLQQRVSRYMTTVNSQGYFQYGGWRFFPAEGYLQKLDGAQRVLVAETTFTRSYGCIELVPKSEGLAGRLLRKAKTEVGARAVTIDTLTDSDVFFGLLKHYFHIAW